MKIKTYALLVAAAVLLAPALRAAEEDPTAKFREALKDSMLKLRAAQTDLANAQAAQYAAEAKATELAAKADALTKDLANERNTSTNMIADLNKKIADRDGSIVELNAALAKWKKSYGEVAKLASKREGQRQQLDAKRIELERKVQEEQQKNIEMYQAGMEILDRYHKFGLGDAILAREPFTATQRVKFQNLVQDLADKLTDSRIPANAVKK
ncbi:MAG: phage major capsid protein [bacterium]